VVYCFLRSSTTAAPMTIIVITAAAAAMSRVSFDVPLGLSMIGDGEAVGLWVGVSVVDAVGVGVDVMFGEVSGASSTAMYVVA